MDVIDRIKACCNLTELDALLDEIHLAASWGEIDFKMVKGIFLKRKDELSGKFPADRLNWRN